MNDEIKTFLAMRAPAGCDDIDLAKLAESAIANGVGRISVAPDAVSRIWAWLEGSGVKIIGRLSSVVCRQDIEKLSAEISAMFKNGADAAQIDLRLAELGDFVADIAGIRDDLFFRRELILGLDINEIAPDDWARVFEIAKAAGCDAIMLRGGDSDFVGRVYAAVECIHLRSANYGGQAYSDFTHGIYFENIDAEKIEQVVRLCEKMRPELVDRLRFFV
jgi:hypothetical protein